ncbi:VOC family protein [Sinomonas sp. ASV322]|uniref:VOC family protein n=1 Tax=Sinomonas sp. ASV322 TaxID=3041920 RepID=UPI0027DE1A3F|nr:VOC family protein [Sinomonas sp. ASV322]MDQ4502259.1 VOC family protein [Sinomonas sp. ASV322]
MTTPANLSVPSQDLLPADLSMGTVMLKVGDMKLMLDYYERAIGLVAISEALGGVFLGRKGVPIIHLSPAAGLQIPGRGEAGLFHTAILFDTRADVAAAVATAAQYDPRLFAGSADHLVSEAFYFTDPEGNGVELYFDKPRSTWEWQGDRVVMDSLPLPPQAYLNANLTEQALDGQRDSAAGVGHVHLQVGDVHTAHRFYVETLGFEQTAGWHGQALFVSAGKYHHHMAMNVWNSRGAGPRKDTLGLGEVLIHVPGHDDILAAADRLKAAGVATRHTGLELRFEDPWRNSIRMTV